MKTTKEKIEVMQAFVDGREIECAENGTSEWYVLKEFLPQPVWDWMLNDYRIKLRTILVNGVKVPEPVRVMPERGVIAFIPDLDDESGVSFFKVGDNVRIQIERLRKGLMHLTEKNAHDHYEALILPSKQK